MTTSRLPDDDRPRYERLKVAEGYADRLRQALEYRGRNIVWLHRQAPEKLNYGTLRAHAIGRRNPALDERLDLVAELLGVDRVWLIRGEGDGPGSANGSHDPER